MRVVPGKRTVLAERDPRAQLRRFFPESRLPSERTSQRAHLLSLRTRFGLPKLARECRWPATTAGGNGQSRSRVLFFVVFTSVRTALSKRTRVEGSSSETTFSDFEKKHTRIEVSEKNKSTVKRDEVSRVCVSEREGGRMIVKRRERETKEKESVYRCRDEPRGGGWYRQEIGTKGFIEGLIRKAQGTENRS